MVRKGLALLSLVILAGAATGSAELLAMFSTIVKGDAIQGVAWCRRAIALNPARENARDMLLALLLAAGRDKELPEAAQEYVRLKDTAHTRYLLALAHLRLRRYDEAEAQARAALRHDPDDLHAYFSTPTFSAADSASIALRFRPGEALQGGLSFSGYPGMGCTSAKPLQQLTCARRADQLKQFDTAQCL